MKNITTKTTALRVVLLLSISSFILMGCDSKNLIKNPLDFYTKKFADEKEFSLILEDMDTKGLLFTTYKHKYTVIRHKNDGTPYEESTGWKEVSSDFYKKNTNNLGMTILEKNEQGKVSKVAAPPGYGYVGDSRYGEWRSHNGRSFWAFYGQYMFMTRMFGMVQRPVYRKDYDTYAGGGYYGSRGYYGPKQGKSTKYGTNSLGTRKAKPNFFRRRAARSGQSSSRSRSGARSRGSGFGK